MESEENRRMKQDKIISQVQVRWEKSLTNKRQAVIDYEYFALEDQDLAVVTGDELIRREEEIRTEVDQAKKEALKAGGLFVLATERHESRRIDNQLRGRSGRQGHR